MKPAIYRNIPNNLEELMEKYNIPQSQYNVLCDWIMETEPNEDGRIWTDEECIEDYLFWLN